MWRNWFDPIDGYPGDVAMIAGCIWHWPINLYLNLSKSPNTDCVDYFILRIIMGYLNIVAAIGLLVWWLI